MSEVARTDWRRLHPRMLLVHPINELLQFLPAVVAAFVFGDVASERPIVQVLAVVLPVLIGLGRYLTTWYRITDSRLELRRGLISRKVLTAPLDRIRTVELSSPVIHRVLKLAKVEIGTGSGGTFGADKLELDSLALTEARSLRASLLHRVTATSQGDDPAGTEQTVTGQTVTGQQPTGDLDDLLLRLDPTWARYAPLTSTGIALLGAGVAVLSQFSDLLTDRLDRAGLTLPALPLLIPLAVVAFVLASAVLSVVGYLVNNWDFQVSRDRAGRSFRITKGLLTTTETSLDTARVHGMEIHEPLAMRAVHAASAEAVVTGLGPLSGASSTVVPPAPREVAEGVAGLMMTEPTALRAPLQAHGPAARRRRYVRATLGASAFAAAWSTAVVVLELSVLNHLLGPVVLAGALGLAHDRARRLGHALTEHHVVFRKHSLLGRRTALRRDGIIGWNLSQTWFQRRQGVVSMLATTSAGGQGYGAYDLTEAQAVALLSRATPGLYEEFLEA